MFLDLLEKGLILATSKPEGPYKELTKIEKQIKIGKQVNRKHPHPTPKQPYILQNGYTRQPY
jgi:hypothetical protein